MLRPSALFILVLGCLLSNHAVPTIQLGLELLHSGKWSNYYVSDEPVDSITAAETCNAQGKNVKLISIENEDEFKEIVATLKVKGIDSIWTSGRQAITNVSAKYVWTGSSIPFSYSNFADLKKLNRFRRSLGGYGNPPPPPSPYPRPPYDNYPTPGYPTRPPVYPNPPHNYPAPPNGDCNCDDYCPEAPTCKAPHCDVNVPDCEVHQPHCEITEIPDCVIIDPQPECVVSCPPCELIRGTCTVTRGPCKVTSPPVCTTKRSPSKCTILPPKCEVKKAKCEVIVPDCIVVKPKPCSKPPICTYNPCNPAADGNYPGHNYPDSPVPPPQGYPDSNQNNIPYANYKKQGSKYQMSPAPCPSGKCSCKTVFHCVADVVCEAPPVICPPAIYNCLQPEVSCTGPTVKCEDQETTCTPPVITCPDYEKVCTEDRVICPAPQTTCTAAVSHCPEAKFKCDKASLECPKPTIECEKLRDCEIPAPCFNSTNYGQHHGYNRPCHENCNKAEHYRRRRSADGADGGDSNAVEIFEPEEVLQTKCIALKKTHDYKWTLEECAEKKPFICESTNYSE